MKLISNYEFPVSILGMHITSIPCVICGTPVKHAISTVYGLRFVCPEHTDEELKTYEETENTKKDR